MATLVGLGFKPAEIKQKFSAMNFKSFEDGWDRLGTIAAGYTWKKSKLEFVYKSIISRICNWPDLSVVIILLFEIEWLVHAASA